MISVFIPALNEESLLRDNVFRVHSYLAERDIEHEIIVVSNGSTDRTVEIGREIMSNNPWFVVHELPERGVGRAFVFAVEHAKYDFVASIDADLPSELTFLEYCVKLLPYCDLLVGSKFMGRQYRPLLRILGSQAYVFLSQLLLRLTVSDYSPDSKAVRKSSVLAALPYLDYWTGYILELSIYCRCQNKRVMQISIDCRDTRTSRFSMLHEAIHRYWHLFKCWLKYRDADSWFHKA